MRQICTELANGKVYLSKKYMRVYTLYRHIWKRMAFKAKYVFMGVIYIVIQWQIYLV